MGDEASQEPTEDVGQADDCGIVEQVREEWAHRPERIRPAEVEQHHRGLHAVAIPRTSSTKAATCSGGVSGTMPCPRLNTNGPPRNAATIARVASAILDPPASSSSGSRLPCTA